MKIAVVDDEPRARAELRRNLERFAAENGMVFQIMEFSDGDSISTDYHGGFDIILMDIEMSFVDGMTAAEEIRKADEEVTIIFITNAPQYAIKGYKVGALDYILKPVSYYAFSETMKRAAAKIRARGSDEDFLTVNVKGGVRRVEIGSILYVEVIDHDLYYHLAGEVIETRGTMRQVESELENYPFFKINKGLLINLAFVNGYFKSDVRVGGELLPVSRPRRKLLLEAVNSYLNRGV